MGIFDSLDDLRAPASPPSACGWTSRPRTSPTPRPRAAPTAGPTAARRSCSQEARRRRLRRAARLRDGRRRRGSRGGVQVAGIVEDPTPLKRVYDPGHPDADAQGYVSMPNVDTVDRDGRPDHGAARLRGERHRDAVGQADVLQDARPAPLMPSRSIPPSPSAAPSGAIAPRSIAGAPPTGAGAAAAAASARCSASSIQALARPRTTPPRPRRPSRPAGHRPDVGRDGRRAGPARDAAGLADPHQGRRGRPGHLPHPGLDRLTHAAPSSPPSSRCPPAPRASSRVSRRRRRSASRSCCCGSPARRPTRRWPAASTRRRPARSRPRSTRRASPTSCSNNGTALAVDKAQIGAGARRARPRRASCSAAAGTGFELFDKQKLGASRLPAAGHLPARAGGRDRQHDRRRLRRHQRPGPARDARRTTCSPTVDAGHRRRHARQLGRHARRRARCAASPSSSPPPSRASRPTTSRSPTQRHAAVAAGRRRRRRRRRGSTQAGRRGPLRLLDGGRLNAMLAQTLGPGKAQVQVNADLNVDKTTKDTLTYAKKGVPLQAHDRDARSSRAAAATAGGAAGTGANIPTYSRAAPAGGGNSNYQHARRRPTDFGVNKKVAQDRGRPRRRQQAQRRAASSTSPSRPRRRRRSSRRSRTRPASTPRAATRSPRASSPSPRPRRRRPARCRPACSARSSGSASASPRCSSCSS